MQELQLLNDKLDALLKKYAALQAENERLRETIAQQISSIESLNSNLSVLEQSVMAATISSSTANDKEKEAMRKQLDNVILEIDKILTSLND
ncbi:hypothetical protein [Polluticoccus soli]|uniref:hypothetical protein n=1 Tax=Polluticoccus soli TaxID=3034150 RepID=UPI0023E10BB5|nr:hypothetical protein [Flavipsychrobacter sp. JY13-12]